MKKPSDFFTQEYFLDNVSLSSLWNQIATPRGLSEWFAQHVELHKNILTFYWDRTNTEDAEIVSAKRKELLIWKWVEHDEPNTVTFKLKKTELTGTVSMIVIDEQLPADDEEALSIWNNHIEHLKSSLGVG